MTNRDTRDKPFKKVILVGEPAVGKTSIRRSFMGKSFETKYISTIGTELSYWENERMSLSIWDLAGEPNFSNVRQTFYTGANGVIAVFDMTRPETLDNLINWFDEFRPFVGTNPTIIMAGNKMDLQSEANDYWVETDQITAFVSKYKGADQILDDYILTSAKTGENIPQLFDVLIDHLLSIIS